MALLQLIDPAPALAGSVEQAVWMLQPGSGSTTRFPAMPRAMLTWQPPAGPVCFHALATQPSAQIQPQPWQALGLVLPPETAARLLGPSTGALVDAVLPWAELAGAGEAERLHEALLRAWHQAPGARGEAALGVLQAGLGRVLNRGSERQQAARAQGLAQLSRAAGLQGLGAARTLGLGERQLQRRCRALLGLGPKQLQRLTRFHTVLAQAVRQQRVPGADAALAAGYHDQSHLAREARLLAGAPLRELLAGARPDGPWWPLATQRAR